MPIVQAREDKLSATGFPLNEIKGFSREHLEKLASLSVTTAEQFISLVNTEDRKARIADFLGIGLEQLSLLINAAKGSLPEDVAEEMERPVDTSRYGLGALKPKKKTRIRRG